MTYPFKFVQFVAKNYIKTGEYWYCIYTNQLDYKEPKTFKQLHEKWLKNYKK